MGVASVSRGGGRFIPGSTCDGDSVRVRGPPDPEYTRRSMLVFIDESGDSGMKLDSGSSPFFVITAVLFDDNFAADGCERGIQELRRILKLKMDFEFHFTNCHDALRCRFLKHVAHEQFTYYSFILNKRKLYGDRFKNSKDFYEFAVSVVCENVRHLLTNAKIVIDKHGDLAFKRRLERAL